jgi:hypothetical protein
MNAKIAYWKTIERDALKALDSARKPSEVKLAASELMRAREMLKWLEGRSAPVLQGQGEGRTRGVEA